MASSNQTIDACALRDAVTELTDHLIRVLNEDEKATVRWAISEVPWYTLVSPLARDIIAELQARI